MRVTVQEINQRRNRAPSLGVSISLAFFLITAPVFSVSFEEAVELEKAGKVDEARTAYLSLLESGDENRCTIIMRLEAVTADLSGKTALLRKGLDFCQDPVQRHTFLVKLARIEEVSGNLETAQQSYQAASLSVPGKKDFESLLASAVLLYETGNYRGGEAQATVIVETSRSSQLKVEAHILLSRIFFATEREDKALQVVRELLRDKPDELSASSLYWVIELGKYTGNEALLATGSNMLLAKYPESPEAYMQRGRVGRLPSLSLFIGPQVAEGKDVDTGIAPADKNTQKEPPEGVVQDGSDMPVILSVQTGSYSVKENAEYALKDLEAEGFSAEIRKRTIGNTVYYRVLIPDVDPEQVDTVILELKESGFEGFRVYE